MTEGVWISILSGDTIILKEEDVVTFDIYKACISAGKDMQELMRTILNANREGDSIFLEDREFVALFNFAKNGDQIKLYELNRRHTEDFEGILRGIYKFGSKVCLDVSSYRAVKLVKELPLDAAVPKLRECVAELKDQERQILENIGKKEEPAADETLQKQAEDPLDELNEMFG